MVAECELDDLRSALCTGLGAPDVLEMTSIALTEAVPVRLSDSLLHEDPAELVVDEHGGFFHLPYR